MPNFLLHCLQRYECTFNDLLSCHSFKHIICRSVSASYTEVQCIMSDMLCECLTVRYGLLKLPDCTWVRRDVEFLGFMCFYMFLSQCFFYCTYCIPRIDTLRAGAAGNKQVCVFLCLQQNKVVLQWIMIQWYHTGYGRVLEVCNKVTLFTVTYLAPERPRIS